MPAVLLVDDRPENMVALEAILAPLGQELVAASSGEEALRILLRRDDFAVILLDAQMPQMDGFDTAEAIKQRERTRGIPIIFLTAYSQDEEHIFRGYEVGAVDYVFKPLNPEILRGKISVFIELYEKNEELHRQRELLALQELVEVRREGAERYRQLADAMPQIVWTADPTGRTTYYNRRFGQYTGADFDPSAEDEWLNILHPDDLAAALQSRADSVMTQQPFEAEYRLRAADGSYRWHLGRAIPILEGNEVDFWIGTATDIDHRKRVEEAQRFLVEAGVELTASLDYRATLSTVARLAVPGIADWCSVGMLEPDGTIVQLAAEHFDPTKLKLAQELRTRYPSPGENASEAAVIASGRSQLIPEITEEMLAESATDERHLQLIHELGLRSWICVPLIARGQILGAISLVAAESGRTFDETDLQLAEELARRAATAVDNARLYSAQLAAFESEQIARTRTERLQRFTSRLAPELTVSGVAEIAIAKALTASEGTTALLGLASPDSKLIELTIGSAQERSETKTPKVVPRDHDSELGEVFRDREPIWLTERQEWEKYPESVARAASVRAIAVMPVATANRFFGVLAITFEHDRQFPEEERQFLLAIAGQTAQALDRARLYEEQSHIAHVLQQSLLPRVLPSIPGVALATTYRAAGHMTGGDFFDVFETADGFFIVIGDVCGKGPVAAALTALCRYTLRASALRRRHPRPAGLLRLLNRAILDHSVVGADFTTEFATVTCLLLHTSNGELTATIASGGHPPTLVRRSTGFVDEYEPTGRLVGIVEGSPFRERKVKLEPGDLVVLYTDGLIDGRSGNGERLGEAAVKKTVSSLPPDADPEMAISAFDALLSGVEITDDIAIVAFRIGDLSATDSLGAPRQIPAANAPTIAP